VQIIKPTMIPSDTVDCACKPDGSPTKLFLIMRKALSKTSFRQFSQFMLSRNNSLLFESFTRL